MMDAPRKPAAALAHASELGAFAPLLAVFRAEMREAVRLELAARALVDPDPIVDVVDELADVYTARKTNELCRRGVIPAEKPEGTNRYVAPRSVIRKALQSATSPGARMTRATPRTSEPWTPELARQRAGIRSSGGAR